MRADVGQRQFGSGQQHDERVHPLSVERVWCCDDRGFGDRFVLGQDVLDQLGRQVLAAADDEVFPAVSDGEVAVRVECADVPGAKPSTWQKGVVVQCWIAVAREQFWAAAEDLALVVWG
jgi:hypothetical protein